MVRLPPRLRPLYPVLKRSVVTTTRAVAPVTALASRAAGAQLPRGSVPTLEAAAEVGGGSCVTVRAAEPIARPAHLGRPARLAPLEPAGDDIAPRTAVAILPHGRVLGPHRAVITGSGHVVDEVSRYFVTTRPREHPLFLNPFPGPATRLAGRVGVLACRGDTNYYHFLVDALSRLGTVGDAGLLPSVDRWYVPAGARFQHELLDLMGIPAAERVDADLVPHMQADELVVATWPAMHEVNPPWVVRFLRGRLLHPRPHAATRRLYVTRGGAGNNRAVRNEDQVLEVLRARGFEAVDPGQLPVREQIRMFADAELVVAAHGAALANLLFVPPGCGVVELFPAGGVLPDYWRLVTAIPDVKYRYLSSWTARPPANRQAAIVRDIDVDIDDLKAVLAEVG